EPSGPRRCRHGAKSARRLEPDMPSDLLRALFGNVTEPRGTPRYHAARTYPELQRPLYLWRDAFCVWNDVADQCVSPRSSRFFAILRPLGRVFDDMKGIRANALRARAK